MHLVFLVTNQPIPIIPWTSELESAIKSSNFQHLLSYLGFHLPTHTGKKFTRIPHFWGPEVLFAIVKSLGPIEKSKFKYTK